MSTNGIAGQVLRSAPLPAPVHRMAAADLVPSCNRSRCRIPTCKRPDHKPHQSCRAADVTGFRRASAAPAWALSEQNSQWARDPRRPCFASAPQQSDDRGYSRKFLAPRRVPRYDHPRMDSAIVRPLLTPVGVRRLQQFPNAALLVGVILVYSASLAILASVLVQHHGFPLDDSWITQTMARNFGQHGVLGFVPGIPSPGATSVLWATIQAGNFAALHADPVGFNLVLSWLILASIGSTLFLLARRDGLSASLSFALAASPALCGNFMWLALIGMEHLLFVAIVLATTYFLFDIGRHRLTTAVLTGIGTGLLAITRPEAMILGPLVAIMAWRLKRTNREAFYVVAIWAIFVGIAVSTNLYTSHSWMPATLQGRTWLYFRGTIGPSSIASIRFFLRQCLLRPSMQFSLWFLEPGLPSYQLLLLKYTPAILVLLGVIWIFLRRLPRMAFLFFIALVHMAVFALRLPATGHGGRYQPLNLLLLFPCLLAGVLFLLDCVFRRNRAASRAIAAVILIAAGAVSLRMWRTISSDSIENIDSSHGRTAEWLLQTPPATRIAAFDIGRISFMLRRPIVDLGGLTDPAYVPYLMTGTAPLYLTKQQVNLVVLPSGPFGSQLGFSQSELARLKVAEFCTPPEVWSIGVSYTGNAEQCQIIYRFP